MLFHETEGKEASMCARNKDEDSVIVWDTKIKLCNKPNKRE